MRVLNAAWHAGFLRAASVFFTAAIGAGLLKCYHVAGVQAPVAVPSLATGVSSAGRRSDSKTPPEAPTEAADPLFGGETGKAGAVVGNSTEAAEALRRAQQLASAAAKPESGDGTGDVVVLSVSDANEEHPADVAATPEILELRQKILELGDIEGTIETRLKASQRNLQKMSSNLDVAWADAISQFKSQQLQNLEKAAAEAIKKAEELKKNAMGTDDEVVEAASAAETAGDDSDSASAAAASLTEDAASATTPIHGPTSLLDRRGSGVDISDEDGYDYDAGGSMPVSSKLDSAIGKAAAQAAAAAGASESLLQQQEKQQLTTADASSSGWNEAEPENLKGQLLLAGTPWDTSEPIEPTMEIKEIEDHLTKLEAIILETAQSLGKAKTRMASMEKKIMALKAMREAEGAAQAAMDARLDAEMASKRAAKMHEEVIEEGEEAEVPTGEELEQLSSGTSSGTPIFGG